MKKLSKIKLNQLSKTELDQRKMNALKGGCSCICGCVCAGNDNSGSAMNSKGESNEKY